VRVPVWLTLGVALVVMGFGLYRLYLGTRRRQATEAAAKRGGGLYRMSPRAHLLVGVVYLLLGGALIATSFGWNPFGGAFGPATRPAAKDQAPASVRVPIDHLPPARPGSGGGSAKP
jgi:hypothetical protein